jgi:hypothetical protein
MILSLSLAGTLFAGRYSMHPASGYPATAPQTSQPSSLSKEYIYAGSKLIATEEPNSGGGSSPLSAPSGLNATGSSIPGAQIYLSWSPSTGGTVDHYQVERCQNNAPDCFTVAAANVTATNYNDTGVVAGRAYLYRIRAVDSAGHFTNYSGVDLATAITFADDPLNPSGTRTIIMAQHLIELRQAVNAVRGLAGLLPASWTYPDPVSNPPEQRRKIYPEDVTDMRTRLDEALTLLGRLQPYDLAPPVARGSPISAVHFMQIRERVK